MTAIVATGLDFHENEKHLKCEGMQHDKYHGNVLVPLLLMVTQRLH
jgi:hypothetical protein